MNNEVFLYVPEVFDPSLFPELAGVHEEAYWFLHKIISLQIFYRHQTTEWVNISQQTIRQFIHPSKANTVRFTLLAQHVIECDGEWRRGCKSLGYRLTEPYRGETKRVQIHKRTLIAKMLRHRIRREDTPVPEDTLDAVHQHLLACLRKVRIDTARAYQLVEMMSKEASVTSSSVPSSPSCTKSKIRKLGSRRRCKMVNAYRKAINRVTIDQISNGELDYVICKQGRVHTPITRLFTEARSCLSIDGRPLVSIDVVNSQLIFFALLFLESQYNRQAGDMDGKDMCEQGISNPLVTPSSTPSSPSCTTADTDGMRFVSLVMEGTVYDYLMGKLHELGHAVSSRREFKRQFFQQVLYGDNQMFYASRLPLAVLFQQEFPSVWEFILLQKRWNGVGLEGEAFKTLAIRMQQRESRFMIGQVCSRLAKYHREIPILTIHDSILTNPEYMPTVRRIMIEEFARLGVQPALRIE